MNSTPVNNSILEEIQDRILWLAIKMVDHSNRGRYQKGSPKLGGHQASSASVTTIMTYLFFEFMGPHDKISIKPHAAPVFHAVQYLLNQLDEKYLTQLRAFGGLQAYPSVTKDPDNVDFSTGSVGLGPITPNFASLVEKYLESHFEYESKDSKYISLLGDAELDEGSVWEAIMEPAIASLNDVLWIVDLNRQSLDRVIPGVRANDWKNMFVANGWDVIDAKYGAQLERAFASGNGDLLKLWIDEMPNQRYQYLLRLDQNDLRKELTYGFKHSKDLTKFLDSYNDLDLYSMFRNLGGHDFDKLREAFDQSTKTSSPTVIFAYTFKGWNLPILGLPRNHSTLLNPEQIEQLRIKLNIPEDNIWAKFNESSDAGTHCNKKAKIFTKTNPQNNSQINSIDIPSELNRPLPKFDISTQDYLQMILTEILRSNHELSERIVTTSPDVATSTSLAGWIANKNGLLWDDNQDKPEETNQTSPATDLTQFQDQYNDPLQWIASPKGKHIELGISENNLFMLLGQLGLSYERHNEILFPIGTIYDCFIRRGLDALFYGTYSDSQFIFVGTPSGISLSGEGGAHQSILSSSIGIELPGISMYEPCFAKELEWILLDSLNKIKLRQGSTYLRLSKKAIDQSTFILPEAPSEKDKLRSKVIDGAYVLKNSSIQNGSEINDNLINIFCCGAIIPEVLEASKILEEWKVNVNVINVTGPGVLFQKYQNWVHSKFQNSDDSPNPLLKLLDGINTKVPSITITDSHPHSLVWIGAALGSQTYSLGINDFGQSGEVEQLYEEYMLDTQTIVDACLDALNI